MSAIHGMPLIDIDTHYTEPPELWASRAPAPLRDSAPRVIRKPDGSDAWIVGRDLALSPPGFCVIRPDGSKAVGTFSLTRFDEMTPAASEPAARVRAMDELGIARQVLYPNVLGFAGATLMRIEDVALRNFCVSAYNDAAGDLQRSSGGRLLPQAMLPFWDVKLAASELERCHDALGLSGFTMTDAPEAWGLPSLVDTSWDPLWSTAQERGLPVNSLRPTEYFRRQIYASFWFESQDVAATIARLGADNVMLETDFPYPTCLYPEPRKKLEQALAGLPEADQRKLFYGNAARVYGIEVAA